LEAFSYSVSHDLRAPLRHIEGFVEIVNRTAGNRLDDESRGFMRTIGDSARHMSRLIDDLLAFSRMGRTEMLATELELGLLVKQVQSELSRESTGRKVEWSIADLPIVRADPITLRQALLNLFSNAVKYTSKRKDARIEFGWQQNGSEHVFFVRDNGVGFDPRYKHKLFGVFQRLHSTREFDGTGIGLAIVRRIIARHGGRTWAEGNPGQGATFYFTLPTTSNS
jgi:light-regulated signal transduction histidine kinase (bacteriophytochrome)